MMHTRSAYGKQDQPGSQIPKSPLRIRVGNSIRLGMER